MAAAAAGSSNQPRHSMSAKKEPRWSTQYLDHTSQESLSRSSGGTAPAYMVWHVSRDMRRSSNAADMARDLKIEPGSITPATANEAGEESRKTPWERNKEGIKSIIQHPFTVLLIAFPLGILSSVCGWNANLTFWLNFAALIPLAKILGDATEELDACLHNEVISGLLNATFGNAVEMIITVQTMRAGMLDVVKATLLGSVLSNLLLVLGMSFFFGGILELGNSSAKKDAEDSPVLDVSFTESNPGRVPLLAQSKGSETIQEEPATEDAKGMRLVTEKEQTFIVNSAMVSMTMLLVSCLSFALPTVFAQGFGDPDTVLSISRTAACIVGLSYFAYLFFQLITHRKMLSNEGEDDDDDDEDNEGLTLGCSIGLLAATTVLVSISSELLVNVIQDVVAKSGISECFIGIILLPIVGNACEHAAAVRFAVQNKPGLSISIAVGSSVQVALFVVPFAVLMGWAINQPMTMDFGILNTTVLCICVLVVMSIVVDGRSNWLEGYMLCSAYMLIAVMYWHVNKFGDWEPEL